MQNKTVIFLGSSVTYGDQGWSMCDYIASTQGFNVIKWAVPGTTLTDVSERSYVSRFKKQIDTQNDCDFFVCQLSTNDAASNKPLGEIRDSKSAQAFDTSTIIGAIEYITCRAKEKWNCPIFFYTGTYFENALYEKMVNALILLGQKWGFGIIDLWNDKKMREIDKQEYDKYMKDHVHPNRLGYEKWWGPKFVEVLNENLQ